MSYILEQYNVDIFYDNPLYTLFHGDLQFDNILWSSVTNKFTYIDWRESFGGSIKGGDIYYDLAKLYGGTIIPYNMMKEENAIELVEGSTVIKYDYSILVKIYINLKRIYKDWIIENGFDLNKVKLITAIIFLNMSPLHDEKFAKMLWFKAIELLSEHYK
jgi:thiamine kinase-like enzyme